MEQPDKRRRAVVQTAWPPACAVGLRAYPIHGGPRWTTRNSSPRWCLHQWDDCHQPGWRGNQPTRIVGRRRTRFPAFDWLTQVPSPRRSDNGPQTRVATPVASHAVTRPCTVPETPVGQTWGNVALLATATLNADTPHSEATPRSAECPQPDGRVHLDAHDDDRRHGTRPARSG